ncbi:hypothetical protein [Prolixibacter denitrificans]|jgi:uncharacterized protein YceK|uniref:TonB-dependent receptor-like protein n=1 Tax=Prolixibacter denitrificans TaxID=1541063 RepID=A0A2P8C6K2_9BACT|nr:hypothetical protein [Prolixibacter denitrificans]PSK80603.1 hypothetical protein CLV93_11440 [Prolixibacter denitrificans]GET22102.1 hypothetical protein JCM18694_23480 [Prolixibacter denitrificans]
MKKILLILIVAMMAGCTSNRYLLTDNNKNNKYLVNRINELKKEGKITDKPLLMVDDSVISPESLKAYPLPLSSTDIAQIDFLPKNSEKAINIYGEKGKNGVVTILTKKHQAYLQQKAIQPQPKGKVLYLVDGLQMTLDNLKKIDKNSIESISVITDKNSIRKYTSGDYNQAVMIKLKKGRAN